MKKNKYKDLINDRIKQATSYINVELNPDDPDLANQISLGDDWDNFSKLTKHLDMHPTWQARWTKLLKSLLANRDKLQAKYNVWESNRKTKLFDEIVKDLKKKGLTEKQATQKVTGSMLDNKFNIKYNYDNEYYIKYKKPIDDINEKIDNVQIIVDAFKSRKDLLIVLGYLVKSQIEQNILIVSKKKK